MQIELIPSDFDNLNEPVHENGSWVGQANDDVDCPAARALKRHFGTGSVSTSKFKTLVFKGMERIELPGIQPYQVESARINLLNGKQAFIEI